MDIKVLLWHLPVVGAQDSRAECLGTAGRWRLTADLAKAGTATRLLSRTVHKWVLSWSVGLTPLGTYQMEIYCKDAIYILSWRPPRLPRTQPPWKSLGPAAKSGAWGEAHPWFPHLARLPGGRTQRDQPGSEENLYQPRESCPHHQIYIFGFISFKKESFILNIMNHIYLSIIYLLSISEVLN